MDSKNKFEKLKELHDMKLLNDNEYNVKRKEIFHDLIENLNKEDYSDLEILKLNLLRVNDLFESELIDESEFKLIRSFMVSNNKDKVDNLSSISDYSSSNKSTLKPNEISKKLTSNGSYTDTWEVFFSKVKNRLNVFFSKKNTKKLIIIFSIIHVLLLSITSYNYFSFLSKTNKPYSWELYEMRNHANYMPFTFLNSSQLRSELNYVESVYSDLGVSYHTIYFESFGNKIEKLPEAIATFNALVDFDSNNTTWDLTNITSNNVLLFLNRNYSNYTYSFRWYYSQSDDGFYLSTNLPSNKDSSKSYYYFWLDNGIMGFRNQEDYSDSFNAYLITVLDENTISVFCYSNGNTYELTASS